LPATAKVAPKQVADCPYETCKLCVRDPAFFLDLENPVQNLSGAPYQVKIDLVRRIALVAQGSVIWMELPGPEIRLNRDCEPHRSYTIYAAHRARQVSVTQSHPIKFSAQGSVDLGEAED
jgi:hypothetical protein